MVDPADGGTLEALTRRIDLLRRLCDAPAHKRDLVDELDASRSTIDRALRELEGLELVERRDEGVAATMAGRLAVDLLTSFHSGLDDVVAAQAVLDPLPTDAPVTTDAVAGSEAYLAADPAPYRPLERFHEAVAEAERYRAVVPALDDPRHVRLLYEHVVTDGRPAELVVTPEAFDTLREEFPRRTAVMAEEDGFEVVVAEDCPPFLVALAGTDDTEPTVATVVFTDSGAVHGVLINDTAGAVRWADRLIADRRAEGTDRTDELAGGTDDGETRTRPTPLGGSLPASLERAGFVRLDRSYFRDEPVAEPTTAWRAGLSLPEVHTGYAVERAVPADDEHPSGESTLTGALVETLADGEDAIVVGRPGSGKSTVCKRVACEWYDADRGPVLYRESGRGRPFEAVDDLPRALESTDGHALVVVEDAVRPEARAAFDARDRLADRADVTFLFDARENEWADPPGEFRPPTDLRVEGMPALGKPAVRRLVAHFERTVGEAVDVPVERLWEDVRAEVRAGDEVAHSGVVLLLHRLSTYADPLAEERTSLEAAAAALYEDLAGDDLALSVAVLANALNAAGLAVHPDSLYAVADAGSFEAVDAAIDRLEGRVLFPRPDGSYRTVHDSWSVAFLSHLLDTMGEEAAADVFGEAVSALVGLADDADRRRQIAAHLGGRWELESVADDPAAWAEGIAEALFALGREQPKLAPLYGDGEDDGVSLPAAAPASVVESAPERLGRAFLEGGYYDRAERAFERLPADEGDRAVERLLGLSSVARERSEFDDAASLADRCLSLLEGKDRPVTRARARRRLGQVASDRGDHESAADHYRAALEAVEATGDRRWVAETLNSLAINARQQGAYDRAREYHERSLAIAREIGDRDSEANSLDNLGMVVERQGQYDRAWEYRKQSLEINRETGNPKQEAICLENLGALARKRGDYDAAREYHERSIEIKEDLGDSQGLANTHANLGMLATERGEYDRAREQFETAESFLEGEGDSFRAAERRLARARLALARGDPETARERASTARESVTEMGASHLRARARRVLGRVAAAETDPERAREHLEAALETFEDVGAPQDVLTTIEYLVGVCEAAGDDEAIERWCRRAADVADEAPEAAVEAHGGWLDDEEAVEP